MPWDDFSPMARDECDAIAAEHREAHPTHVVVECGCTECGGFIGYLCVTENGRVADSGTHTPSGGCFNDELEDGAGRV